MKLLWIEKITQNKARVYSIHNFPEMVEDKTDGILVDDILPKPELKQNEYAVHYINPQTKEQSYEICTIEKTQEDIEKETLKTLVKQVAEEKLKNIQKDKLITETTKELAKVKLDIIELKKGSVQ
ncbi:hypothetical protein ACLD43_16675 [Clostridium botulinum]|uniref:hypothetical protein n=1 Tax=Clostridium botulinum TaxID=1491 RepID=UPI003A811333